MRRDALLVNGQRRQVAVAQTQHHQLLDLGCTPGGRPGQRRLIHEAVRDPRHHASVRMLVGLQDRLEVRRCLQPTLFEELQVWGAPISAAEPRSKLVMRLKSLLEIGEALPPFWRREGDTWQMVHFG